MDILELKDQDFSLLGRQSSLKGDFELHGIVRMSSKMEGILKILEGGKLTIEPSGKFSGKIYCEDVEIFGEFDGEIHSTGRVILQPASKVSGNIKSESMTIYPGAEVNIEGNTL
jgi:cytoskeletal protein CcmA (bactofilin family)